MEIMSDNKRKCFWILVILLASSPLLPAQDQTEESRVILPSLGYAYQFPGGDLQDRFGANFSLNLQLEYLSRRDWGFRLEGGYLFGTQVKEDVLARLRTREGNIIGNDRAPADIQLRQRGWYLGAGLSRLFRLGSASRSGLLLSVTAGLLQHRIRIQDDPLSAVPQLNDTFQKGYDRLANGLYLTEFVGYRYLANDRRINFYAGLEFTQAFTQNRRSFDYDLQARNDSDRLDLLYGLRIGWILPFYLEPSNQIVY
jgi:hypothetical protein